MPLSYKQLGNTFIQGQNITIYPSGNTYAISSSSPTTDSFGFQGVSIAGYDFFPPSATYVIPIRIDIDYTGPNSAMVYKSFSAGTGIGIIDSNNTLIFTAATRTINALTSFTSAGTGNRLLLSTAITSNTLFYKSLTGTSNLSINDDNNGTLTFSLVGAGTGTIISGTNVGTGNSFFTGLSTTTNANDTLVFRNLLAGPNINIAPSVANDGDILISRGSPTLVNQISNIGGGARVLSSITSNSAITRTISGTSGFTQAIINNASTGATSAITASTVVNIAPTNTTASRLYISNATSQLTTDANFGADATTGSLGIGGAAVTTSRLLIAAGTGAISQLRLTPFTASTSLIDGDIWYSTSGNTLKFYKNNISTDFLFKDNNLAFSGVPNSFSGVSSVLLVNTAGTISGKYINSLGVFDGNQKTITYTNLQENLEYSIIGTPLLFGSQTLLAPTYLSPPNFITSYNPQLITGKKFRFTARGNILYDGFNEVFFNYTSFYLYFKIKIGLDTEIALGGFFIDANGLNTTYNSDIELDVTFTIKDSGKVSCSGKIITYTTPTPITSDPIIFGINSLEASISTELDQLFNCVVYASTNGGGDWYFTNFTLQVYESFLEVLN